MAAERSVDRASGGSAGDTIARTTLWILLGLLMVELAVEGFASSLGLGAQRYTFLWVIGDRFDDYFKFVLSFPADGAVRSPSFLADQVAAGLSPANPYRTPVSDLSQALYSHFHTPPLVAVFCLRSAALMRLVDPGLLFLATVGALAGYWILLAVRYGETSYQRLAFGLAGLIAYPMMLMAARGNVYAGATGLLIVHALILAVRQERPVLAAVLLAAAINIRPNAVILLPLLPLLYEQHRLRALLVAIAASGGLFAASLAAAHAAYPDYTWGSFQAGLAVYYRGYVLGPLGPAFSSSLFAVAKMLFGYRPGLDLWAALPGFAICGAAMLIAWQRRIEPAVLLFLLVAGYCLSSSLFCDYHLLPFIAVPLVLAGAGRPIHPRERCALIASCLVLAPKCYVFTPTGLSLQIVLNPLILLAASGWLLWLTLAEWSGLRRADAVLPHLEAA